MPLLAASSFIRVESDVCISGSSQSFYFLP
jgi:hypothetical protein